MHDVKKPAARLGFGVFGDFTLQTPKTRPPTPLGHRVFGCTKKHDLGLHLRVSVPQQCLRGLLWPYEASYPSISTAKATRCPVTFNIVTSYSHTHTKNSLQQSGSPRADTQTQREQTPAPE
eukprot:scaffold38732_cov37-Phaeocystis_antarctica.AAC.1